MGKINYLILACVIALFYSNSAKAQFQITISLKDSVTNEPIKYACIANNKTKKVVAFTNELGEFKLANNNFSNDVYLIKCLGYRNKISSVSGNATVYLQPIPTELNTVVVNDINSNTIFLNCIEKLKANQAKKKFFKAFYSLHSLHENNIFEIIESFYSVTVSPNIIDSAYLENGRFAFFDSSLKNTFVSSINLSNLVTLFNILNCEKNDWSIYPIIPFYDFNESKYVEKQFVGSKFDGTERVLEFNIKPKDKYKRKAFNCSVWIGQKTFNIKKIKLSIVNPQKTILNAVNENSICLIDSVLIEEIFNDYNSEIAFPEQVNFKFMYKLRNGDNLFPVATNIKLVNFEETNSLLNFKQAKNLTDREKISDLLYEPNYWKNVNKFVASTQAETEAIDKFASMSLFGNPLLSKDDTLHFLLGDYHLCDTISSPKILLNQKPNKPLNYLVFKRNEVEVAEVYFDIYYAYCLLDKSFKFRVLPLFNLQKSWCNNKEVEQFIYAKIFPLLNDLTLHYSDVLTVRTNELVDLSVKPDLIIQEKNRILEKFYLEQDELIKKIWLNNKF